MSRRRSRRIRRGQKPCRRWARRSRSPPRPPATRHRLVRWQSQHERQGSVFADINGARRRRAMRSPTAATEQAATKLPPRHSPTAAPGSATDRRRAADGGRRAGDRDAPDGAEASPPGSTATFTASGDRHGTTPSGAVAGQHENGGAPARSATIAGAIARRRCRSRPRQAGNNSQAVSGRCSPTAAGRRRPSQRRGASTVSAADALALERPSLQVQSALATGQAFSSRTPPPDRSSGSRRSGTGTRGAGRRGSTPRRGSSSARIRLREALASLTVISTQVAPGRGRHFRRPARSTWRSRSGSSNDPPVRSP